jgi:hypothetical protein
VTSHVDPGLHVTVVAAVPAVLVFSTTHGVGLATQTKLHSGPAHAFGEHGHALAQTMSQAPPVHDVQASAASAFEEESPSPESVPLGPPSPFVEASGRPAPGRVLSPNRSS